MNKLMAWVIVPLVLSSAVSCSKNTTLKDRFSARKEATRIISMLNAEQFVDAETSIRNDLKKKKLSNDGQDWGYLLFDCLTNTNVIKEDTLNRWCQQSPNSFPAFLSRGYFYVNYAWYARGSDWAETVSEDRWQLFYTRLEKAKTDLEKAAALDAKSAYPYSALIKICTGLGLPREQMENYFQSAIRLEPTFYPVYRAKLVYLMPKWHGTVEDLFGVARQAAANAPKHSAVPLVLAEAHMEIAGKANDTSIYLAKKDVREEMESIYAAFFREFPKATSVRAQYAEFIGYLKPEKEVLDVFDKALSLDKNEEIVYYERARYFKRVKKYAKAIADYAKTAELDPFHDNGRVYSNRGICCLRLQNYLEALLYLQKALIIDPYFSVPHVYIASIFRKRGKNSEAIVHLNKAYDLGNRSAKFFFERGLLFLNIGEYQKAVEEYTTYIGLRPEEPAGYHNRASAYKHLKNMAAYQKDKVLERQLLFKRSEDEAD